MRHLTPHFLALVEKVRYGHLIAEVERLDSALASASAKNAELEEQLRAQLAKTGGLERELADASAERAELQKQLVDASNETGELRTLLTIERGNILALGGRLMAASIGENELRERLKELEEKLEQASDETTELTELMASASAEAHELRERLKVEVGKTAELEENLARVASEHGRTSPKTGAEWQFNTGPNAWSGYPADRSEELQARFEEYLKKGGPALVRMRSGVEEYDIDLKKMQQTNARTKKIREIRCTFNTPAHWTRCCSLAAIYHTQPTESIELSGFQELLFLNAVYTKDESVVVNGYPVWWSTAGDVMMYRSPASHKLNIYSIGASYPEVRSGNVGLALADLPGGALDPWRKSGWRERMCCVNVVASSPTSSGVASLMSIAIDVSETRMMSKLTALLSDTVIHQQPHFGGSACNSFKTGVRVIRIVRIENWHLWMKYRSHAEQIKRDLLKYGIQVRAIEPRLPPALERFSAEYGGGVDATLNECLLLHGTSYQTAVKIALEGFDFRTSRPGRYYGQGTYFASQACKSQQYTGQDTVHTTLLGRVALGDVHYAEKVDGECRRPPEHAGTARCCDSVVAKPGPMPGHRNGVQTHQEFVIFDKFQAYPELLLQYVVEP